MNHEAPTPLDLASAQELAVVHALGELVELTQRVLLARIRTSSRRTSSPTRHLSRSTLGSPMRPSCISAESRARSVATAPICAPVTRCGP